MRQWITYYSRLLIKYTPNAFNTRLIIYDNRSCKWQKRGSSRSAIGNKKGLRLKLNT